MTPLDAMKQALEVFTHCYAETERRAKDRAKSLADLSSAIAELESAEPVAYFIEDCATRHRGPYGSHAHYSQVADEFKTNEDVFPLFLLPAASIESKHWEITAKQLGKQLDECERERNELRNFMSQHSADLNRCGATLLDFHVIWREQDQKQLASVTKERDEFQALNNQMPVEYEQRTEQLNAYQKDAMRYQMLRRGQHWSVINGIGDILRGDELDAAIDEVMK